MELLEADEMEISQLRAEGQELQTELQKLRKHFQELKEKLDSAETNLAQEKLNALVAWWNSEILRQQVKALNLQLESARSMVAKGGIQAQRMRTIIDMAKDLANCSNQVGWQTYMESVDELRSAITELESRKSEVKS